MEINGTGFGWIDIDKKRYRHDIVIYGDGTVENRYTDFHWTSHSLTREETKKVTRGSVGVLVVGSGQYGVLKPTTEALAYLKEKGIRLAIDTTPAAIKIFNTTQGEKCGLFHVTC